MLARGRRRRSGRLLVLALKSSVGRANRLRLAAALPIYPLLLALQGRSPKAFLTSEHGWRKDSAHDTAGTVLAPLVGGHRGEDFHRAHSIARLKSAHPVPGTTPCSQWTVRSRAFHSGVSRANE
jgi:hypothetical protein